MNALPKNEKELTALAPAESHRQYLIDSQNLRAYFENANSLLAQAAGQAGCLPMRLRKFRSCHQHDREADQPHLGARPQPSR